VIPARKSRAFNAWFAGHARARIEKTFGRVLVRGLARAREIAAEAPIVAVSNHTSWWDPLVILHASQHLLGTDGHALMDAKNLRRLPFFSLVGAFGVDLDRAADGAASVRYAARLLDRPGRLVWIFPQGAERPVTERPLGFREGAAHVARVAKRAVTLPAALRYEFAGEELPRLYLSFGAPLPYERDVARACAAQEAAVLAELDAIDAAIAGRPAAGEGFELLHRRDPAWLGSLAERMLATLTRPRDLALLPTRATRRDPA
jgi:1-acyl-sn-glycerol-3-phosphate acyltransferase